MTTLAAPSVGRFLSSDPAQAGSNWYAYCDNNPLVRVDPTGLYWWFDPDTGILYWVDPTSGSTYVKGRGYSGRPGYRKSKDDDKQGLGPIPGGDYWIGPPIDHITPVAMRLLPVPWNHMHGRGKFLIHGDNTSHNASSGCIILPPKIRKTIAKRRNLPGGSQLHVGTGPIISPTYGYLYF